MAKQVFATYEIESGLAASRPVDPAPANGRLAVYQATDTGAVSIWNGSAWQTVPFLTAANTWSGVNTFSAVSQFDNDLDIDVDHSTRNVRGIRLFRTSGDGVEFMDFGWDSVDSYWGFSGFKTGTTSVFSDLAIVSRAQVRLGASNVDTHMIIETDGSVNVDSGTLYADAVNNFVGVRTATPSTALDVVGTFRCSGTSTPTTGAGVEFEYIGATGYVSAYDRGASAWKPFSLRGLSVDIRPSNVSKLLIDGTRVTIADDLRMTAGDIEMGASGPRVISGSGTPEGVVTAPVGSMFMRSDGGAGTSLYVKESGVGNTGWVGK